MERLEENIIRRVTLSLLKILSQEDYKKIDDQKEDFALILKSKKDILKPLIKSVATSTVEEFKRLKRQ